jgi:hypothetical protein
MRRSFKNLTFFGAVLIFGITAGYCDPVSAFDEAAIQAAQGSRQPSSAFSTAMTAFEASNDASVKAAKWKDIVNAAGEGLLAQTWTVPSGGWKLLDFPSTGTITIKDVRDQQSIKASYTKLVAQNETEAVQLRGAGALLLTAALDGESWGQTLLLGLAQQSDDNMKQMTYWFSKDFGEDVNSITWTVDWSAWQQAYNAANALGKAIILRNITSLALKRREYTTAANINLSALSGSDRELKAIALAFGHPDLGSAVTTKWSQLANDSDTQIKALAAEVKTSFGITD